MPAHIEAIRLHGPCPQHRRTFAPIKQWFPLEVVEDKGKCIGGAGHPATTAAATEAARKRGGVARQRRLKAASGTEAE